MTIRPVLAALIAALALCVAQPTGATAQEAAFLEGSEDIPLMTELAAVPDAGIVFDSPAGRIVESFAAGPTSREAVLAFYADTLPALGWEPESRVRFNREGESLTLDFFGPDGELTVRFTLAPAD
ncbi:MAG: hypothetical protein RIB45_17335 [Marivibrio sp.]|uniref:hypothetical protein n=1 Tax=Marivibrio sp. TaxID=2039719 RepID=UPI0032EAA94D